MSEYIKDADFLKDSQQFMDFTIKVSTRIINLGFRDPKAGDAAIWDLYKLSKGHADAITNQMIMDSMQHFMEKDGEIERV